MDSNGTTQERNMDMLELKEILKWFIDRRYRLPESDWQQAEAFARQFYSPAEYFAALKEMAAKPDQ